MKKLTTIFLIILTTFLIALTALGSELGERWPVGELEKASALLFPETANWTPISKMQPVDHVHLRKIEPALRHAYEATKFGKEEKKLKAIHNNNENEYCLFIDNLLSTHSANSNSSYDYSKHFYLYKLYKIDHDKITNTHAIIYTGPSPCSEQHATLIWFGTKKGNYVIKQESVIAKLALRIKTNDPALISSVDIGCCDSILDKYFIGTYLNFQHLSSIPSNQQAQYSNSSHNLTRTTVMPSAAEQIKPSELINFLSQQELIMRSSPAKLDQYNAGASANQEFATFGNVLTKYLPNCSGKIIGKKRDKDSNLWYFVAIDEKICNPLCVYKLHNANVGWISAKNIIIKR